MITKKEKRVLEFLLKNNGALYREITEACADLQARPNGHWPQTLTWIGGRMIARLVRLGYVQKAFSADGHLRCAYITPTGKGVSDETE
jgi:hypothetical protein